MRLLERALLREALAYGALCLGVFLFVLMTPEVLRLSELLVRENIGLANLGRLLWATVPAKLVWAVPLSVLTALLLAMSRAAADREVVALEAVGVNPRRLLYPLLLFAAGGTALTLLATAWWGPAGARTVRRLQAELAAGQAGYEVKPRVFDERFRKLILYVQDTDQAQQRWRGVFLADLADRANPVLTVAREALVTPEPAQGRLRLHLYDGTTHTLDKKQAERYNVTTFAENIRTVPVPVAAATLETRRNADLGMAELWQAGREGRQGRPARADFHRRLALPAASLVFAALALPLGLLAQRAGRSMGFVAALGVALAYYFLFLFGDRLAREGNLAPALGVWLANSLLFLPALAWLAAPRGLGWPRRTEPQAVAGAPAALRSPETRDVALPRQGWRFPRRLDLYVIRGVCFYFVLLLAGLVLLFSLFTVLEMVDDIAAHRIHWTVVARFVWYLLPQAVYWMAPLGLMLAVLVELALLEKRNELVAMKGAGISLYRVAAPLVALGLALSSQLFWLDDGYLPRANQQQEALRNQIKGRPPQTVLPAERRWIFGEQPRIYHYAFFDPARESLGQLDVIELDPQSFAIRRRLVAQHAHWTPDLGTWVLDSGWQRDFTPGQNIAYQPFDVSTAHDLTEPPTYFLKELRESYLMNWRELGAYINELSQSGFDITRLTIHWHRKIAFPLVATLIVLIAFPFGLTMGRRGAVGGLAAGIALGFSYWALVGLFENLGNIGLLPALLAAWGPNLVFLFLGVYLSLRVQT